MFMRFFDIPHSTILLLDAWESGWTKHIPTSGQISWRPNRRVGIPPQMVLIVRPSRPKGWQNSGFGIIGQFAQQHTVDGSEIRRSPPGICKTL